MRCRSAPERGKHVCRRHRGPGAVAEILHGRYSRAFGALQDRFLEFLGDTETLRVEPDLAVQSLVVEELVARAVDGDSPDWRQKLAKLVELHRKEERKDDGDPDGIMHAIFAEIEQGAERSLALVEAAKLADMRANRAQKERALMARESETLSRAAVMHAFGVIFDAIQTEVPGEEGHRIVGRCQAALVGATGWGRGGEDPPSQ